MRKLATMYSQKIILKKLKSSTISFSKNFTSKILGSKIYFIINGAFGDEGKAVLAGNHAHFSDERLHRSQMFLRRSVHRLEKGLITPNRRETFAADYIGSAVRTWIEIQSSVVEDHGELQWAADVFNRYFEATTNSTSPSIRSAQISWLGAPRSSRSTEAILGPFQQSIFGPDLDASSMLSKLSNHRRSIRFFDDRPVSKELVDEAIGIGLTAPSACNRQSFRIAIVVDPIKRVKVARVPMGTAGFADQIPAVAVLIGQHRGYEHHRDRHAIYVDGGLFATGFILALESLGLNSCCINWPEIPMKEKELRSLIHLESDERPIMMIAIGYGTDGQLVPRSHKREINGLREWI